MNRASIWLLITIMPVHGHRNIKKVKTEYTNTKAETASSKMSSKKLSDESFRFIYRLFSDGVEESSLCSVFGSKRFQTQLLL